MGERAKPARPLWLDLFMAVLIVVPVLATPYLTMIAGLRVLENPTARDLREEHELLTEALLVGPGCRRLGF